MNKRLFFLGTILIIIGLIVILCYNRDLTHIRLFEDKYWNFHFFAFWFFSVIPFAYALIIWSNVNFTLLKREIISFFLITYSGTLLHDVFFCGVLTDGYTHGYPGNYDLEFACQFYHIPYDYWHFGTTMGVICIVFIMLSFVFLKRIINWKISLFTTVACIVPMGFFFWVLDQPRIFSIEVTLISVFGIIMMILPFYTLGGYLNVRKE